MTSIFAIDFGNENTVIAAPENNKIIILNNKEFQRLTPSMISFSDSRRYYGLCSQQEQIENIHSTVTHMKQLVGLKYESEKRKTIEAFESCKLVPAPTGFTFLEIKFLEKRCIFTVEQCIAFFLKGCFDIAKLNNIFTDQCVIVIPPWWSEVERRVIIDSAKISGMKVAKLLNSTTAGAISYFIGHRNDIIKQGTGYALFVDFGDCCLSSAVIQFHDETLEVKSCYCDDNIGGFNFTKALVEYLLKITKEKYDIDPSNDHQAMIKFIKAAEKLKKELSFNPVMKFEVNSLFIDTSIGFLVERSVFEEQIQSLLDLIESAIDKSIELANIKREDLIIIEILGGTSKIPAVKTKVAKMFNRKPIQPISLDEYFAIGAGYQAALLSPQFHTNLKVNDIFNYNITIRCVEFPGENHEIFTKFHIMPSQHVLTHNVKGGTKIKVFCNDTIHIGTLLIIARDETEDIVQITFLLNQNGIIEVPQVVSVTQENHIDFRYKPKFGLIDTIIDNLAKQEKEMEAIDKSEEDCDDLKNSLESYLIKIKNAIERDSVTFFDPDQIERERKTINKHNEWFYENEDKKFPIKEYKKRYNELYSIGDPVFRRQKKKEQVPLIAQRLIDRANNCRKLIPDTINRNIVYQINFELDQYIESIEKLEMKIKNTPDYKDITFDEKKLSDPVYRIEMRIKSFQESNDD